MQIVRLSENFYSTYSNCDEILKKENRPYMLVIVTVNENTFAIPFRSHIKHKYAYWTDKPNHCGLDFTKAVIVSSDDDISQRGVQIRQNEFNAIKGREYDITKKFASFLNTYKKAYLRLDVERNRLFIEKSALKYFIDQII